MRKTVRICAGLLCALLVLAVSVHADVIAQWENDDVAANDATAAVDTTHANVSASVLSISGLNTSAGWTDALTGIQNNAGINTLALAISNGHYFSLTITPDAGASVSYSDMFFRYSLQANVQTATTEFSLLSSETGFTASDAIDTFSGTASVAGQVNGSGTFDITGASALQNVAAGTPVEFRVYVHNTGANPMTRIGNGQAFATQGDPDLTLNGTVSTAIPEPATLSLFGLALVAVLATRKRRGC